MVIVPYRVFRPVRQKQPLKLQYKGNLNHRSYGTSHLSQACLLRDRTCRSGGGCLGLVAVRYRVRRVRAERPYCDERVGVRTVSCQSTVLSRVACNESPGGQGET